MPAVRKARRNAPARPRKAQSRGGPGPARRAATGHALSMKLGAWARARLRDAHYNAKTRAAFAIAGAAVVLSVFVLLAAAVGILDDMGRGVQNTGVSMARGVGLSVRDVRVQPATGLSISEFQQAEVEAVAGIAPDEVLFSVDPTTVRDRVMSLPWVEGVLVRRLWPNQIQIVVQPRAATAVWQHKGRLAFIDVKGRIVGQASVANAKGLPLVTGASADVAAPALFELLATRRGVADRILLAERISERRWTLKLRTGGLVLLPETGLAAALDTLESLQASHRLLDRTFARLDVRTPGVLLIRPQAEAGQAGMRGV
jgi:cell division protein FtsQ